MTDAQDYEPTIGPGRLGQTWVQINGEMYGARPDETGPIGGGAGYVRIVTRGDLVASNVSELIEALQKARPGQTVLVDPTAEIDLTGRVRADGLVVEIPGGVTLASDRGKDGSPGGLIYSDEFATSPMLRVTGDGVRITGLRLRGPDPQRTAAHINHRRTNGTPSSRIDRRNSPSASARSNKPSRTRAQSQSCRMAAFVYFP